MILVSLRLVNYYIDIFWGGRGGHALLCRMFIAIIGDEYSFHFSSAHAPVEDKVAASDDSHTAVAQQPLTVKVGIGDHLWSK